MQNCETESKPKTLPVDPLKISKNERGVEVPGKLVKSPVQCKHCPKKYKVLGALKNHEMSCLARKKFKVEVNYCEYIGLQQPADENYEELMLEKVPTQEQAQNICKECGQSFKYVKMLHKHEAMHKGKFSYWCKLCMQNFSTYEEKMLHKMNDHPDKDKNRKCRICPNIIFESEEEYLYHITEMHRGKFDDYYMCSDCGRQFKTKSELTHHNNSKCGTIKRYKCKVCNQDLMTAGSLHNHMLRHTGERCCMCGYCGKLFLTVGQLKVHERTHTQEKAFVCNVCGKGFCHRQSLITHSTLHTGVKPYQCDNCGHSFSCVGNLIKHRRTHADTCGVTPLTTHRVNNPLTKMKVKINTPKSSKLKTIKKERELQEKLAAYKEKINRRLSLSENESYRSDSNETKLLQNSDALSYESNENKSLLEEGGSKNNLNGNFSCEFVVKSEEENLNEEVPYISNGFLQTRVLELEAPKFNENCNLDNQAEQTLDKSCDKPSSNCEREFFKEIDDLHNEHFLPKQETKVLNNWSFMSETPGDVKNAYDVKHFLPDNSVPLFGDVNSSTQSHTNSDIQDPESHLCHTEDLNENSNSSGHCDSVRHQGDDYCSSEDYYDASGAKEDTQEESFDSKANTVYPKTIYKSSGAIKKQRQKKITETEIEEFMKQRGFTMEGTCQYCQKVYINMRWLIRHEKEHEKKTISNEASSKNMFKCSCCKIGFETREACKVHQQHTHADILTCQECDKLFSNVDSLRSHQNIFHKGLPRKVYVYVCEKCGLQFRQKAFLNHHEKSNCGASPVYECRVCGKGFNSIHTRRSHLRIHDPKKTFLCKFCGKSFRWKGQLKIHERSHTGEKPFKCLYCPKAFAYRESLITHSSLHTGIKPHLCQACGSRFSCIGNLIKHRATHASTCGVWYSKNQ